MPRPKIDPVSVVQLYILYAQLRGSLTDFCHETLPLLLYYNAPEIRGGTNAKALSLRADFFPVELQVRFRKQLLNL